MKESAARQKKTQKQVVNVNRVDKRQGRERMKEGKKKREKFSSCQVGEDDNHGKFDSETRKPTVGWSQSDLTILLPVYLPQRICKRTNVGHASFPSSSPHTTASNPTFVSRVRQRDLTNWTLVKEFGGFQLSGLVAP